jgi:hypothetical protein
MNPSNQRLQRLAWIALLASLVLCVLGARWATVYRFGSDIPEWDEWDACAMHALLPYEEGREVVRELWAPHNEHRILPTKLLGLALVRLNGQWDQRVEAVCNAGLSTLFATGLLLWARRRVPSFFVPSLVLLIAFCWGLPLAWQNVLGGFHSPQFFLLGCALLCITLLTSSPQGSARWFIGLAGALVGLVSMGSGLIAPGIVLCLLLLAWWRGDRRFREIALTLLLSLGLVLLGLAIKPQIPSEGASHAHSLREFLETVMKALRWPSPLPLPSFLLVWLPWAWLALRWLRGKPHDQHRTDGLILLGLGTWVLLQCLASSLLRGAGSPEPSSRYLDLLLLGSITNLLALAWLQRTHGERPRAWLPVGLSLAWLLLFGWGALNQATVSLRNDLPQLPPYFRASERSVRNYVMTRDRHALETDRIPYPNPDVLRDRLDVPYFRSILPVSCRQPLGSLTGGEGKGFLAGEPAARETAAGLPSSLRALGQGFSRGSYGAAGTADTGEWRSHPFSTKSPWLRIEMAGTLSDPGVRLELLDAATGAVLDRIQPIVTTGEDWRPAYVRNPGRPFLLRATDDSRFGWLAFGPPSEQAAGSQLAIRACLLSPWLLAASLLLFLAGTLAWTVAEIGRFYLPEEDPE